MARTNQPAMPQVVTFYSYKGGTGRSMALANVAWILAANGKRVLAIDWDLEAPGLHRYFHPFLHDPGLTTSDGVIDFVLDFALAAVATKRGARKDWYKAHANMLRCATSLDWKFGKGTLDFIPAGRLGPDYATRVNSFDWQDFYERLDGGLFLEAAKQSFEGYDYVLIDSRTGVSDTSGICTVQMPDVLVVCFTLNTQSIEGGASVAESADAQRRNARGERTLRIFPVPMRVERAEQHRMDLGRLAARDRLSPLLWHLDEKRRSSYWERIDVAYQPFYAYEEVLATFADPPGTTGTLLSSFETLTEHVTGRTFRMPDMTIDERRRALARFARGQDASTLHVWTSPPGLMPGPGPVPHIDAPEQRAPASEARQTVRRRSDGYSFYVSYAKLDFDQYLERFVLDLAEEVRLRFGIVNPDDIAFFDRSDIVVGASWTDAVQDAIGSAKGAICVLTPNYAVSEYCGKEFAILRQRAGARTRPAPYQNLALLPVVWGHPSASVPASLRDWQLVPAWAPQEYRDEGLRYLTRLRSHRDAYKTVVATLGERLADGIGTSPLAILPSIPKISEVPNAFAAPAGAAPAAKVEAGPTTAMLLVVSADVLWKAFETPVISLAQSAASRLLIRLYEVPAVGDSVETLVGVTGRNANPLVVVIDPLATDLPAFTEVEQALTKQTADHVVLVAPVNRHVAGTAAKRVSDFFKSTHVASTHMPTTELALRSALEQGLSKARANIVAGRTSIPTVPAETARPQLFKESM